MVKKFTIPFASQGDANDIPDALQVDGKVSFTQGFSYDYERPYDDPQAKDIAREDMNGLFKAITSAIGELQTLGASEWSNVIAYPKGAIVYFEKDLYISQVDDNQNKPPQNWVSITSIANDSLKKAANLSDLTNKATARSNLGLGSSATLNKTDVLGTSTSLVATQKLVNDTKINLDNSVRAVDVKADTAQSTANTAVTKADNAQNRADSAYNLANSKQDPLVFSGTGNVARMSEVNKKRDLSNNDFSDLALVKSDSFIEMGGEGGYIRVAIANNNTDKAFYFHDRVSKRTIYLPINESGGTLALRSDLPGYYQKLVDMTSQRSPNVTYNNNTSAPITIIVVSGFTTNMEGIVSVDGVSIPYSDTGPEYGSRSSVTLTVPPKSSYSSNQFEYFYEVR